MLKIILILNEISAFPPDWHMKNQLGNSTRKETVSYLSRGTALNIPRTLLPIKLTNK